jgi:hypothetical protein
MANKQYLLPVASSSGSGGGGVSSFTGDGSLITNSASTGAVTVTLGTLPATSLPIPSGAETAGLGFFFGGFSSPDVLSKGATINSTTGWTANQAYAFLFYQPSVISVGHVSIYCSTLSAGTTASAGIYSVSGTKLIDSGTFATTSTGVLTNAITPVTIQAGFYYYVFTTSSAANGFEYFGTNAANLGLIVNALGNRAAKGTATSGGALNSPLGALTALAAVTSCPLALFEP